MSHNTKTNEAGQRVTLIVGRETPSPAYRYQSYCGKSGHLNAKPTDRGERKFVELQNLRV